MELGYFAMPLHPAGRLPADWIDADLDNLTELDRLGFDEAWFGEHFTNEWEPLVAPDLFIARAIGATRNIRLGTGVNSLSYHNPVQLASRIAFLDHLARGRFMWGIGNGALPTDGALFGVDFFKGQQRAGSRAVLSAVLDLWKGPKPGVYETPFFRYTIPEPDPLTHLSYHMRPYTQPHPPIAAAGSGPASDMLGYAGENGWIPMSVNFITPETIRLQWQVYAEHAATNPGVVPDRGAWRVCREIFVARSDAKARELARGSSMMRDWMTYLLPLFRSLGETHAVKTDPGMSDDALTEDYLLDELFLVGSPETVSRKVSDLFDYTGGFGVLAATAHEWDGAGHMKESMRLLAEEVRPLLPTLSPVLASS